MARTREVVWLDQCERPDGTVLATGDSPDIGDPYIVVNHNGVYSSSGGGGMTTGVGWVFIDGALHSHGRPYPNFTIPLDVPEDWGVIEALWTVTIKPNTPGEENGYFQSNWYFADPGFAGVGASRDYLSFTMTRTYVRLLGLTGSNTDRYFNTPLKNDHKYQVRVRLERATGAITVDLKDTEDGYTGFLYNVGFRFGNDDLHDWFEDGFLSGEGAHFEYRPLVDYDPEAGTPRLEEHVLGKMQLAYESPLPRNLIQAANTERAQVTNEGSEYVGDGPGMNPAPGGLPDPYLGYGLIPQQAWPGLTLPLGTPRPYDGYSGGSPHLEEEQFHPYGAVTQRLTNSYATTGWLGCNHLEEVRPTYVRGTRTVGNSASSAMDSVVFGMRAAESAGGDGIWFSMPYSHKGNNTGKRARLLVVTGGNRNEYEFDGHEPTFNRTNVWDIAVDDAAGTIRVRVWERVNSSTYTLQVDETVTPDAIPDGGYTHLWGGAANANLYTTMSIALMESDQDGFSDIPPTGGESTPDDGPVETEHEGDGSAGVENEDGSTIIVHTSTDPNGDVTTQVDVVDPDGNTTSLPPHTYVSGDPNPPIMNIKFNEPQITVRWNGLVIYNYVLQPADLTGITLSRTYVGFYTRDNQRATTLPDGAEIRFALPDPGPGLRNRYRLQRPIERLRVPGGDSLWRRVAFYREHTVLIKPGPVVVSGTVVADEDVRDADYVFWAEAKDADAEIPEAAAVAIADAQRGDLLSIDQVPYQHEGAASLSQARTGFAATVELTVEDEAPAMMAARFTPTVTSDDGKSATSGTEVSATDAVTDSLTVPAGSTATAATSANDGSQAAGGLALQEVTFAVTQNGGALSATSTGTDAWPDIANAVGPADGTVATASGSVATRSYETVLDVESLDDLAADGYTLASAGLRFHVSQSGTVLGNGTLTVGWASENLPYRASATFTGNVDHLAAGYTVPLPEITSITELSTVAPQVNLDTPGLSAMAASIDAVHLVAVVTKTPTL